MSSEIEGIVTIPNYPSVPILATDSGGIIQNGDAPSDSQLYARINASWSPFSAGIGGSGTATNVAFWVDGTDIGSDSYLNWDNANKRLSVGMTTPAYGIDVYDYNDSGYDIGNSTTALWNIDNSGNATFNVIAGTDGNNYAQYQGSGLSFFGDRSGNWGNIFIEINQSTGIILHNGGNSPYPPNSVQTNNNTLDDGSGNATFIGNITADGSASFAGGNATVDSSGNAYFYGTLTTNNNTLDDGSGNAHFAGSLTTTNNTLDDGSGNANFIGNVIGASFNFNDNSGGANWVGSAPTIVDDAINRIAAVVSAGGTIPIP